MATASRARAEVDYSLLERFTELLICARCFRKHVRQPVRQLVSGRHRPLALCHVCASRAAADERAPVLRFRQANPYMG